MKRSVCYYVSGVVVGVIAIAGYRYVDWGNLKSADWAAWVQAVGSIGAILVAIWVSHSGLRAIERQRKYDASQQSDRLAIVTLAIAVDVTSFLQRAHEYLKEKPVGVQALNESDYQDILSQIAEARRVDSSVKYWGALSVLRGILVEAADRMRHTNTTDVTLKSCISGCFERASKMRHEFQNDLRKAGIVDDASSQAQKQAAGKEQLLQQRQTKF
ncbi:hypothetical protein [Burkholderia pseudomultivorans]|uniref:hypothetical protein n=1 Tax=Burkholderia pseudomultivorans TaxID=1207504 RepID=UPI0012DB2E3F|nr:hypothetical protein [Burkholderia pseudomultivorans]